MLPKLFRLVFTLIGCGLIGTGFFWAFVIDPALVSSGCGRPCSVFRSNAQMFGQVGGALVTGLIFGLAGAFVLWAVWGSTKEKMSHNKGKVRR
jgi:hypothetical protein